MSIYEYDEEIAKKTYFNDGISFGKTTNLLENLASIMDNLNVSLTKACELLSVTIEEYQLAKEILSY